MKIPIFLSCPTALNPDQEKSREIVLDELKSLCLEPRALGRSDYPTDLPLREVYVLATHCPGGVILGFEQFFAQSGIYRRGTKQVDKIVKSKKNGKPNGIMHPTPWNHLEAGILFGLGLPLLVFRETGIQGGIFDPGVTDVFVNQMPPHNISREKRKELKEVFLKWQSRVSEHYYRDRRV
jgi:hypothetical protein